MKINQSKSFETIEMVHNYELVAKVLNKLLHRNFNKVKTGEKLTDSEVVAHHEIASAALTICKQLNSFKFSDYDLIKIKRVSEIKLREDAVMPTKTQLEQWPGTWHDEIEGPAASLKLKCEAEER